MSKKNALPLTPKEAPPKDNLNNLGVGDRAVITKVSTTNHALREKLLSMGLVTGTMIELMCVAPFGDPIQVRAMGYNLALRRVEAQGVEVAPLPAPSSHSA